MKASANAAISGNRRGRRPALAMEVSVLTAGTSYGVPVDVTKGLDQA